VAEVFADLDPALDAREDDVEPGTDWTGWHPRGAVGGRLDRGHGTIADKLLADTTTLVGHPDRGARASTRQRRCRRFEGGRGGQGHRRGGARLRTDLWDFQANVEGAFEAYSALQPVLSGKDAALDTTLATGSTHSSPSATHAEGEGFVGYDT
jgi:iron uptake system component EfeO